MKFFGHGIVWDAKKNKELMRFDKNNEYQTEDIEVAQALKNLGYKHEGEIKAEQFANEIVEDEIVEDEIEIESNKKKRK